MSITIHLRMDAVDALRGAMARAPELVEQELLVSMTEATMLLERDVKERMPRVSGMTAGSVTSDAFATSAGVLGVVGSALPVAAFLELGTKPHMPPVAALVPWVRAAMGIVDLQEAERVAFLVARKIGRYGTKPKKHFESALRENEAQIRQIIEEAAVRIASQLVVGGAT